jgi:hypothetical protein
MRSALPRRITRLESAVLDVQSSSGPVTQRSFLAQVERRMRLTGEGFEEAVQTLLVKLRDDELETLITQAEASAAMKAKAKGAP